MATTATLSLPLLTSKNQRTTSKISIPNKDAINLGFITYKTTLRKHSSTKLNGQLTEIEPDLEEDEHEWWRTNGVSPVSILVMFLVCSIKFESNITVYFKKHRINMNQINIKKIVIFQYICLILFFHVLILIRKTSNMENMMIITPTLNEKVYIYIDINDK